MPVKSTNKQRGAIRKINKLVGANDSPPLDMWVVIIVDRGALMFVPGAGRQTVCGVGPQHQQLTACRLFSETVNSLVVGDTSGKWHFLILFADHRGGGGRGGGERNLKQPPDTRGLKAVGGWCRYKWLLSLSD